jgi:hypothetical protein
MPGKGPRPKVGREQGNPPPASSLPCSVPGCGKVPYRDTDGKVFDLCSYHLEAFVSGRLKPGDTRILENFHEDRRVGRGPKAVHIHT